ncbi:U5 snRNP-specific spliceosomal protein [Naegleria gruberi]|uniref:U5 snRNP-specific spliceosomal protein n=1 Tax=Naegleria gruberi TaxID=5762 RepID=D2UY12_NAEGR|nr:U5 snRNP-specific spliceosomal protein [Naegleria gruberi]EFC50388.1 U5 snRNP-specific spliceosomal protein [Naegleria gruberi]|eukprot:XP_002683132.1 U5 snRNP-specific spliceosomal protein [Naegleria gruberi strain NEG-M]
MGDRVIHSKPPASAKKKKKQEQKLSFKKKQSILDINTSQEHYNPKTDETRTVYESILDKVQHYLGDVDHDTLRGAVDEILTIMHDENQSDHQKQEEVSQILSSIPSDEFAKLYQLCKRTTDFVVSDVVGDNYQGIDEGIALVSSDEEEDDETEGLNNQTVGYVVSSDSESDISDSEQPTIVESSKMEDEEEEDLDITTIDSLWLQKELSKYYSDSIECKKLSNGILDILSSSEDEHDIENQLVQILDYDKIDMVQKLMRNRLKIIYCTRLHQAATKEEKEKIEQEMMTNDSLVKILEKLKGTKISSGNTGTSRVERENYQWKGERVINLENLTFEEGSHLMSNRDFTLPSTASTAQFKGYEQITIPYSSQDKPRVDNLIEIKSLPEWSHKAFPNMVKLNAVQSIIFKSAFYSPENLLICAPTGAGKTNVAVLTMLHEIGLHMDESFDNLIDLDFKMIYIAPMKALVQEVVGNLSERLKPYNIVVQELTGDRNMTKQQIDETQIIVTTPEKWDIVTRKSGDRTYVEKVKLIIIDEIHLLHDERGPVLESIVARTIRQQESTRQNIRLVGLSATLPNYKDVATFLRVKPDNLFYFDSSFRPCPLDQYYIGVNEKKPFKRHKLMNEIVYNKVVEIAGKHQIIVFVHSRKDTYKTAKALRDMAIENDTIGKFVKQGSATSEILKEASQKDANGAELKELLSFGVGIHHAGMTRNDRTLVEDLFDDERLQVLVSTATLAWGVNLPARRVIIKGTQVYSPEKGDWTELSALDVMQMIGRAGRFPRDSRGEGLIVTTQSHLQYYLALLNQQLPIESQFIKSLPDNLNAEVVLGTVQNIDEAINWLGYTYLYVRMLRNPLLYGITKEDVEHDKNLYHWRRDLVYSAALILEKNGLIKFDKRSGDFQPTDLGRVASHYYVTHKSIATFNNNLKPNLSDIELFRLFSLSDEFSQMTVRQEEKLELSKLIHSVPIPIKESADDPSAKVNVLLQAYISRLRLNGFALIADMTYITQSAARIARALFEIIMHRGWAQLASKVLNLAKMIEHKMWYTQTPLRQFPKIEQTILKQLEGKNTLWERLYDYTPAELGRLVHHNQRGKDLYKYIHQFPRLDLTASVQPITPSTLRIELTISPDFQYNKSIHGAAQTFWIFVEDVDGEVILHHESFVLKQKYAEENHFVSFTVPIYEPLPPHYFIKVISDRWLHSEQTLPISFRHLILPQKAPQTTELLDLPPLEISALKNGKYEQLLSNMGVYKFNPIQTQVFRSVYHSEDSVLIAAPGGSGKSLCGVLAIMKMFNDHENSKCVYIAAIPSVANKREKKWISLFEQIGKRVVNLTGNLAKDMILFEQGDIIISTPEQFDMFSRKWKARKSLSNVKLVVADELHMIGGEVGPIIEVVISRIRYMSSQLETNIRIVGLSASILNAKDVADWIGTKKECCFNFHPRYRSIPLEINIQGFTQSSYNARQVAMSKPAYKVIKQKSGGEQTIIFTSSPKQASFISSDLIDHLSNDINSKIFVGDSSAINHAIGSVDSSALKEVLTFGIAFYHETLTKNDKQIVEELYSTGVIKVLVVTHQMCWGMEQKSKLVIIMGTEYYNGKEHRYTDYSIIDMVQMMSRSGRIAVDKDSTCYIFCAASRKDYLLKFLYEPFPVESHLDHFLYDPLNAEISSKIIENKQGAVDYLTWTFLYRRIRKNPNYYNLSGTTKIHLSDYLSELVESSLEELQKCNCILVEDDEITAMNLGTIAAHYYVKHSTIEIYSTTINSKTKLRGLLEVLGYSTEFEQLPIRQKENHILRKLFTHAPLKVEKPNYTQVSTKVNLILQSHFSRTRLTPAMEMDKKQILLQSVKLLRAMVDVIGNEGFLTPALAAMEMSQMITQALWDKDPFLMQLPHFTKEICSRCEQGGIITIFDLINMEDDERNQLLGFGEQQMIDVAKALNRYPNIELAHEIVTANEDITTNSTITLAIRFDADDVGDEPIYAPYFPEDKLEEWWIVIGDHFNNEIKSIKRLPIKQSSETMVKFLAPSKPGKYEFKLYFMCDSYTGCDQEYPISFTVLEGEDDDEMADEN